MTVQDNFFTTNDAIEPGISVPVALIGGGVLAAALIWLAQGTNVANDGPEWHGNSGDLVIERME